MPCTVAVRKNPTVNIWQPHLNSCVLSNTHTILLRPTINMQTKGIRTVLDNRHAPVITFGTRSVLNHAGNVADVCFRNSNWRSDLFGNQERHVTVWEM